MADLFPGATISRSLELSIAHAKFWDVDGFVNSLLADPCSAYDPSNSSSSSSSTDPSKECSNKQVVSLKP